MQTGGKLAILVLCFYALACGSMMVDKNTHDYPQASKDAFISSCTSSGGTQAACTCMLNKVQQKYTYGEMEELEKQIKSNQESPEFKDFMAQAANECRTAK